MASPQTTASAKKIANYTQSISSGVTNLLTELGRVNTAGSSDANSNNAILSQLQTLTTLMQHMNTRLAAVEKSLQKVDSTDGLGLIELEPESSILDGDIIITAEEHNTRARRHNKTVGGGDGTLMPLRTPRNTLVVGFPSTLGHLVFLDSAVQMHLAKAFGISDDYEAVWAFIGANMERRRMSEYYSTGESLAEHRMAKRSKRESEIAAAGPVTAATKRAAAAHNLIARARNATSTKNLMPIHDYRNIPVYGWPRTLQMLVNMYKRWDVLELLEEYGQSVKQKDGCVAQLIEFVGADAEEALEWAEGGEGEYGPHWLM